MTSPSEETSVPARASGTFAIGGVLNVHRLGFGAMRLPGIRGEPERPSAAREILRDAVAGPAEAGMMAVHARLCDRLRLSFKRSST